MPPGRVDAGSVVGRVEPTLIADGDLADDIAGHAYHAAVARSQVGHRSEIARHWCAGIGWHCRIEWVCASLRATREQREGDEEAEGAYSSLQGAPPISCRTSRA